jgi:cytochrome P450
MDPLNPPPPEPAYFDRNREAWVLSRYADVAAAFREPRLWPVGTRKRERGKIGDVAAQARLRGDLQTALSSAKLAEWEWQLGALAQEMARELPADRPVDLVAELAMPWSLRAATLVTGAAPERAAEMAERARAVSAASAEPYDETLQAAKASAEPALERHLEGLRLPMAPAAFVALSHTLPCLLADMWLALLRHPREMERLRAEDTLWPAAIEELLRYAGLARMLFRQAMEEATIGGLTIPEGGHLVLRVASANRDPEQFADPNRLDLGRRPAGQLALGAGGHSCAGAALIRMSATAATRAVAAYFGDAEPAGEVEWQGGSGFQSPRELWVRRA